MGRRLTILGATIGLAIWAPIFLGFADALGEEVTAEDLHLERTFIKSNGTGVTLTPAPVLGFSPTTVSCPRRRICTIRVEVSSQFENLEVPNIAAGLVLIDNSQDGVQPFSAAGLATANMPPSATTARTFTWVKTGLTHGEHTVDVFFFVSGGTAALVGHTLTIQTFSSDEKGLEKEREE